MLPDGEGGIMAARRYDRHAFGNALFTGAAIVWPMLCQRDILAICQGAAFWMRCCWRRQGRGR
jgi:hypothetical protein